MRIRSLFQLVAAIETFRQHVHDYFEFRSKTQLGKLLEYSLFLLIFINVVFSALETVAEVEAQFFQFFKWFETISVLIFTLEYILRLWVGNMKKRYNQRFGRIRYTFSLPMLFDLVVIIPFYLQTFFFFDARWIRIFRLVRIFRIMRLAPYSIALDRILAVLKREKEELVAIFGIMVMSLFITSAALYAVENKVDGTQFTSIPATFWWGVATLTTIGYGDMVPLTPLGKILGSVAAVLGVGIFALPTGLLGASFYREVTKQREQVIQRKMKTEFEAIKAHAEESGEKIDQVVARLQRRNRQLERELTEANEKITKHKVKITKLNAEKSANENGPPHGEESGSKNTAKPKKS